MTGLRFESWTEPTRFHSPLAGMQIVEQRVEVRRDPLTGMTALTTSGLDAKEAMFFGKTDWEYVEELAERSRPTCFFCSGKVFDATPRFSDDVLQEGMLQQGEVVVFPNLFPLAAVHAVVTAPEKHLLRPSGFTAGVLEEWLGAAVSFAGRAEHAHPGLEHLEVCCNYLQPAGASLMHPHMQVLAGSAPPGMVLASWGGSSAFRREHGVPYWTALVDEEERRGERLLARTAACAWLVPFAPAGAREVVAVVPGAARVSALGAEQVAALAAGLARVLAWYERKGLSAFNFTLIGGPLSEGGQGHPVVLRVIARAAFRPDYRTDDFFLQKQLGAELMFEPPELLAAELRKDFTDL